MKLQTFTAFASLAAIAVLGCGKKSPYDVTADQIKAHSRVGMPGGPIDPNHLPPGAIKQEKTFKKGETLPDGTVAKGGEHVSMIQVKGGPGRGAGGKRQMFLSGPGPGAN